MDELQKQRNILVEFMNRLAHAQLALKGESRLTPEGSEIYQKFLKDVDWKTGPESIGQLVEIDLALARFLERDLSSSLRQLRIFVTCYNETNETFRCVV